MVGIPAIPEQREGAAGAQDATDLAKRLREPKPVEGLPHRHGVHVAVRKRDPLRRPGERRDAGHPSLELQAHLAHGLERDQMGTARDEETCELARPRSPEPVRRWTDSLLEWLTVQEPTRIDPSLRLGPGEAAAIALAQEWKADWVLL